MARAVSPSTTRSALDIDTVVEDGQTPSALDADLARVMLEPMKLVHDRLLAESVRPEEFWDSLFQDVMAESTDAPLTTATLEIAVIRGGGSHLNSDQIAGTLHRHFQTCRQAIAEKFPRQSDQLKLRYAPLKQAYQAYGPGLIRSIGHRIWNAAPPDDWWPKTVYLHAVQPLHRGDGDVSTIDSALWIEAVLTDINPDVPEWLRLVYLLTCVAVDGHARTHQTSATPAEAIAAAAGLTSATSSMPELPWRLGTIPLVLHQAFEQGVLGNGDDKLPIELAASMWWSAASSGAPKSSVALTWLPTWWREIGQHAGSLPPALKQLSVMLAS